jgi:hypothetical protein
MIAMFPPWKCAALLNVAGGRLAKVVLYAIGVSGWDFCCASAIIVN